MEILQHIIAFVIALGILITFHEFGHFWVARKFDVKILRFSIGFGSPLWKKTFGKDKTELVIAALPLGGYVKMLDEREAPVSEAEKHRAFNRKPLGQRTAIVLAGPAFNFLFAILAYWLMYLVGLSGLQPIVGEIAPQSIASTAGIKSNDRIIAVDSEDTSTWTMVVDRMINHVVDNKTVRLTLSREDGSRRDVLIDFRNVSVDDLAESGLLERIGITPSQMIVPAVIGEVKPGLAADKAGLQRGDRILRVNGEPIKDWRQWVKVVRENPGKTLTVDIARNGTQKTLSLTPASRNIETDENMGFIGAVNLAPPITLAEESYGPVQAFVQAISISIAQYAGESAKGGLSAFLWFLGIVSVSLGVLNLLPIPLLDGGHLLYYLIEFLTRKPVSESAQIIGQQIGLVILLSLMVLVFYNDIVRLTG